MIVYMYLSIIVAISILTGVIVTMIERKGFYPKVQKIVEKEKKKQQLKKQKTIIFDEPVITNAVTVMNMKPLLTEDDVTADENYDIPVLVSSYTVDLSDVVHEIKKSEQDEIEVLDFEDTFIAKEGLV